MKGGMEIDMIMFEYEIDDNVYSCYINDDLDGVEITGYRGKGVRLILPERIVHEGKEWKIRGVGKKAFSGNQMIRSVVLPATIRTIGDWAFSQCGQLEGIQVQGKSSDQRDCNDKIVVQFGNGVFMDCTNIRYIAIGMSEDSSAAVLLATTVHELPSEYLLTDAEAGSEHWFEKWDLRLRTFLSENDDEGYTNIVLCGEEDITSSETEFAAEKRRKKAGLCLCRLQNDNMLSEEMRQVCIEYLVLHTKGQVSEATWEYIVKMHGDDLPYYRMLANIGGITKENIDEMIQDLDVHHAEAKAYLLQYKQEHFATADVFDMFSL